ncbi:MAG: hypothetical protein ACTSU2_09355 [Promethearchaeota archaeon]
MNGGFRDPSKFQLQMPIKRPNCIFMILITLVLSLIKGVYRSKDIPREVSSLKFMSARINLGLIDCEFYSARLIDDLRKQNGSIIILAKKYLWKLLQFLRYLLLNSLLVIGNIIKRWNIDSGIRDMNKIHESSRTCKYTTKLTGLFLRGFIYNLWQFWMEARTNADHRKEGSTQVIFLVGLKHIVSKAYISDIVSRF